MRVNWLSGFILLYLLTTVENAHVDNHDREFNVNMFGGTCFMFYGDSILRQLYHTLIHGVIRKMPVVVDPVYGFASYRLSMPSDNTWHDSFKAVGKLSQIADHVKTTAPHGWTPETGVEIMFSFQQACDNVVVALQKLKASNVLKTKRRVVFVFNLGATNVLGKHLDCLNETLPLALSSLSLQLPHLGDSTHHVVMMNQPIAQTRLRGLTTERFLAVNQSVNILISKVGQLPLFNSSILDFKGIVESMKAVPVLEDNLHYGCMWGSVGKGRMAFPWGSLNEIGNTPAYVRGLHFTFNSEQNSSSCGLVCDGVLLNQVAFELLSVVSPQERLVSVDVNYKVDLCVSVYDYIPCPLYPGFDINSHWVEDDATGSKARNSTYHQLLGAPFAGLSEPAKSQLYRTSLEEFHTGGFKQCRTVPEYVRFVDSGWCEAALSVSNGHLTGTWCALPERGTFTQSIQSK